MSQVMSNKDNIDSVSELCLALKNLIDEESKESNEQKFNQSVDAILSIAENLDQSVTPYSRISSIIFSFPDKDIELSDILNRLSNRIRQSCVESGGEITGKYLYLLKVSENLSLANTQKIFLYGSQQSDIDEIRSQYNEISDELKAEAQTITGDVNNKIDEIKKEYYKITKELDEAVDTRMNAIYSGFVSVLGIFVAISFSLFGAATLLNNIFNIATRKGFDTSSNVIGTNIVLAGFTTILVYLLIVGLFQGIGSITNHIFDFSIRRFFIIMAIAGAVIISGFLYSHSNPNITHVAFISVVLLVYTILCLIVYKFGTSIKKIVLPKSPDKKQK